MRTLVLGDVHGNYKALTEVFERSGFDSDSDRLISLGDVYDGHPDSARCVEVLRTLPDFIWCLGNHDSHARWWLRKEWMPADPEGEWSLGSLKSVIDSYRGGSGELDLELIRKHAEFIETAVPYFIDEAGRLYLHAGMDWRFPVDDQAHYWIYYADRLTYREHSLLHEAQGTSFPYKDVFIGHTKTIKEYPDTKPVRRANLWNLDTGAGTDGKLTIMDADTFEYWQSESCK